VVSFGLTQYAFLRDVRTGDEFQISLDLLLAIIPFGSCIRTAVEVIPPAVEAIPPDFGPIGTPTEDLNIPLSVPEF